MIRHQFMIAYENNISVYRYLPSPSVPSSTTTPSPSLICRVHNDDDDTSRVSVGVPPRYRSSKSVRTPVWLNDHIIAVTAGYRIGVYDIDQLHRVDSTLLTAKAAIHAAAMRIDEAKAFKSLFDDDEDDAATTVIITSAVPIAATAAIAVMTATSDTIMSSTSVEHRPQLIMILDAGMDRSMGDTSNVLVQPLSWYHRYPSRHRDAIITLLCHLVTSLHHNNNNNNNNNNHTSAAAAAAPDGNENGHHHMCPSLPMELLAIIVHYLL